MCGAAAWSKAWEFVAATLLMYDTYLRPGDMLSLMIEDFVPAGAATGPYSKPVVIVAPQERGSITKVGEQDGTGTRLAPSGRLKPRRSSRVRARRPRRARRALA